MQVLLTLLSFDQALPAPHSNEIVPSESSSYFFILLRKYNLELYMTATELTESTERGVWGGKSISVFSVLSVAESYKKQIQFSIVS